MVKLKPFRLNPPCADDGGESDPSEVKLVGDRRKKGKALEQVRQSNNACLNLTRLTLTLLRTLRGLLQRAAFCVHRRHFLG